MRIVIVGVAAEAVVSFRGEMLRAMAAQGHTVLAMAPEDADQVRSTLAAMGVGYQAAPIRRTGLNPVRDAVTVLSLYRTFRTMRADCVLVYGAKPVIYGSLAARLARVRLRTAMITGAGSALTGDINLSRRLLSRVMRALYAVALRGVHVVFFQNGDDLSLFRSLGLLGRGTREVVINGSGVDLTTFHPASMPDGPVTFLMIGRLIRDKGVYEYVEAARRVRRVAPQARFQLLGPLDTNPSAISAAELDAWGEEGVIEYLGRTSDVRPYLVQSHVCVLPSYGEGMPRSILEAMAMARPVLVTDAPGCRETVIDGENGMLVPVRDAGALADAMLHLIEASEKLAAMGRRGREIAEQKFDVREVNAVILGALGLIEPGSTAAGDG